MAPKNDSASQLTTYLKELGEDYRESLSKVLDSTTISLEIRSLKALREVMKYEGFDPKIIMKKMLEAHTLTHQNILADADSKWSMTIEVETEGVKTVVDMSNDMEFHVDVQHLCLIFISRGAAYDKIFKKSGKPMQELMSILKEKYGITTIRRQPGTQLDANVITLPRIAATFPTVTVELFHQGLGRTLVEPSEIVGRNVEWPRAFLSPMVASMIPHVDHSPKAQLLAIAVAIDDLLHQTDTKTKLKALFQYMMASYQSTAINPGLKISRCKKWGILQPDQNITFADSIVDCREDCKSMIRRRRAEDPDLERILSLV